MYQRMLCIKFCWNRYCDSEEKGENVKCLQIDRQSADAKWSGILSELMLCSAKNNWTIKFKNIQTEHYFSWKLNIWEEKVWKKID